MEEEEPLEPITLDEVEHLAGEASQILLSQTGACLPRLTPSPLQAESHVKSASLGIDLPLGSLFYPCCGSDTKHAITSFGPYVSECHFADPYNAPSGRPRSALEREKVEVPHVGVVVLGDGEHRPFDDSVCRAYSHAKDGLLTLIDDVPLLSVFYYRGDSTGEGGSNQRWLEPVLFHTVLAKLLDGGLIVTNGPNCGSGRRDWSAPWDALCASNSKDTFVHARRRFRFVGDLDHSDLRHPRGVVRLWRVTSE